MSEFWRSLKMEALAAGITGAAADKFERALRREWGGQKVYLAKRDVPTQTRLVSLSVSLKAGTPAAKAFVENDIPRSTGYRYMSRKVKA
jgi:hypothetical protein